MSNLSIFEYDHKLMRTVVVDGNLWFVAKDVCDMLDIANTGNALARLADSMKGIHTVDTLGGPQEMSVVNEAGVYKIAFTSRKPEAEAFTDFVAGTILPTIRKTGQYQIRPMTPAELIAAQARLLVDQERRINAVEEYQRETAARVERIAEATEPILDTNARDQLAKKIRSTCYRYQQNYQNAYNYLYQVLEAEAHCDLEARVRNKRDRMSKAGILRSHIDEVNKLDVICEDRSLVAHFDRIIQRWAISLAAKGARA